VMVQPRMLMAGDVLDSTLYRITHAFSPQMGRVKLAQAHEPIIQAYLSYSQ
jgi:hypothetical protein